MSEKSTGGALQYVILALVTINLALTAALWMTRAVDSTSVVSLPNSLPEFADAKVLSDLANSVQLRYNSRDIEGLYDLFDDLAKVQFSQDQLQEQLESFFDLLGIIESFAYSHFEKVDYGGRSAYVLHYKVRLVDGSFPNGTLKINVVEKDGEFGFFGFNLFGGTQ